MPSRLRSVARLGARRAPLVFRWNKTQQPSAIDELAEAKSSNIASRQSNVHVYGTAKSDDKDDVCIRVSPNTKASAGRAAGAPSRQ